MEGIEDVVTGRGVGKPGEKRREDCWLRELRSEDIVKRRTAGKQREKR